MNNWEKNDSRQIVILNSQVVSSLLVGCEAELITLVRRTYEAHVRGDSSLPHSIFLRFPGKPKNRIIALPAYLGGEATAAGVKWISSFPSNIELGLDRAFAVIVLNCVQTGRPQAILEGSIISAKRTAASAALAALRIHGDESAYVGIIGCGLINFETIRFLLSGCRQIKRLVIFDIDSNRAEKFKNRCLEAYTGIEAIIADNCDEVIRRCPLISLATTAVEPHIKDLSMAAPGSTLLHISLRDIAPEAILDCDNVADDINHVCRAQTSLHLAEQMRGNRDFIRCTLGEILAGKASPRRTSDSVTVFSPFGLGILDLAVGKYALDLALENQLGIIIDDFQPESRA